MGVLIGLASALEPEVYIYIVLVCEVEVSGPQYQEQLSNQPYGILHHPVANFAAAWGDLLGALRTGKRVEDGDRLLVIDD